MLVAVGVYSNAYTDEQAALAASRRDLGESRKAGATVGRARRQTTESSAAMLNALKRETTNLAGNSRSAKRIKRERGIQIKFQKLELKQRAKHSKRRRRGRARNGRKALSVEADT